MRLIDVGGSPLEAIMQHIEGAARRQGFVLINGNELIDPAQFFKAGNDNDQDCGCPPGFCAADENAQFDTDEEHLMASIFGDAFDHNVFGQAGELSSGHGQLMMTADEAEAADLDEAFGCRPARPHHRGSDHSGGDPCRSDRRSGGQLRCPGNAQFSKSM